MSDLAGSPTTEPPPAAEIRELLDMIEHVEKWGRFARTGSEDSVAMARDRLTEHLRTFAAAAETRGREQSRREQIEKLREDGLLLRWAQERWPGVWIDPRQRDMLADFLESTGGPE